MNRKLIQMALDALSPAATADQQEAAISALEGELLIPKPERQQDTYKDMTLRDYFAAKAMAAIIVNQVDATLAALAGRAYAVADAMLKARES